MPDKVSAYLLDNEEAMKSQGAETPWGKAPSSDRKSVEKHILSKFNDELSAAKSHRAEYYDNLWSLCDRAYWAYKKQINLKDMEKEIRSNIRIPYLMKQVESQASKVFPSMVSNKPLCSVSPNHESSRIQQLKAKGVQKQLRYDMFQKQNGLTLFLRWIKQGERLGLSPLKLSWLYEEGRKIARRPKLNDAGEMVGLVREVKDKYIKEDRPCVNLVNTRRLWWNPDCVDPDENLRYTYELIWKPLRLLKEDPLYVNTDKIEADSEIVKEETTEYRGSVLGNVKTGEPMVKLYERFDKDYLITVAGNQVIRYRDNPFDDGIIPYYFYRSTIVDDFFVGMGVIEPGLDLEGLANTILNQRLDNVHRVINKMYFIGATSGFKGDRLRFRPGGVEKLIDVNGIKEFQVSDVTSSAYIEEQQAEKQMSEINGDPELTRGEMSSKRTTATEASIASTGAQYRLQTKIWTGQFAAATLYRDMYRLRKQFGDPSEYVQVFGTDGMPYAMRHDDIFIDDYKFDYSLGGPTGNRMIEFHQMTTWIDTMARVPGLLQKFNLDEIANMMSEKMVMGDSERMLQRPGLMTEGFYRDPYKENQRMYKYQNEILVLPGEVHTDHIPVHTQLLDVDGIPPVVKGIVQAHLAQHLMFWQQDQAAMGSIGGQMAAAQQAPFALNPAGVAESQASGPAGITLGGQNAGRTIGTL